MMTGFRLLTIVVAVAVGDCVAEENSFSVVSYLPEWRFEGANWDEITKYSSHLILFSLEISPSGDIISKDRIPRKELLDKARLAADKNKCHLLICFGGNGRSGGFHEVARSKAPRDNFVEQLDNLIKEYNFDGVDFNWEYPGYRMGEGYLPTEEIAEDYDGLLKLLIVARARLGDDKVITMAYYPDGRQESHIIRNRLHTWVDLLHMMSYDQQGEHHSSIEFTEKATNRISQLLVTSKHKFTIGLPFYGRHKRGWTSYEDLVQEFEPLDHSKDKIKMKSGDDCGFNGVDTIRAKVKMAIEHGLGGVMIWEVGQDCRIAAVEHEDGSRHEITCPKLSDSLLYAIGQEITANDYTRSQNVKEL